MLIRVGILGLVALCCVPGLSQAQQFLSGVSSCVECGLSQCDCDSPGAGYGYSSQQVAVPTPTYSTAQLPTFSTASQYVTQPQTMVPVYTQRPSYSVQYQRQAQVQQVPVTSYRNVTVDRGSYQMVWVPRPVTQQVAQTTLQNHVSYRTVAVPVERQTTSVTYVPSSTSQVVSAPIYSSQSPSLVFAPTTSMYATAAVPQSAAVPMIAADAGAYSGISQDYSGLPLYPEADASVSQPIMSTGPSLSFQESSSMDHAYELFGGQNDYSTSQTLVPRAPSLNAQAAPGTTASRNYERPVTGRRSARGMFEPVRARSSVWQSRYTRGR